MVWTTLLNRHSRVFERGFSLIEMMSVSAIFIILSSVVLANNTRFGSVIALQNLAHSIALSIREAQVYGLATLQYGSQQFDTGYGMRFSLGNTYILYADLNSDGNWDSGETLKSITINGGYSITQLCAPIDSCGIATLDIIFKRPEPDACISADGSTTLVNNNCTSAIQRGMITIMSNGGDTSRVVVESTGQISVQ